MEIKTEDLNDVGYIFRRIAAKFSHQPMNLWLVISFSFFWEGFGVCFAFSVENLKELYYVPPEGGDRTALNLLSVRDIEQMMQRSIGEGEEEYQWDCGFELSPAGMIEPKTPDSRLFSAKFSGMVPYFGYYATCSPEE